MSAATETKYVRCPECGGKREIIGLGLLRKDCPTCDAVGYVPNETEPHKYKRYPKQKVLKQVGE